MLEGQTQPSAPRVRIRKGAIFVYRAFDVAEEIDLPRVEQILSAEPARGRLRLARSGRSAFIIRNAPVSLGLGETEVRLGNEPVRLETFAKVWDYGVISFVFQLPIPTGAAWSDLLALAALIEAETKLSEIAARRSRELSATLREAMQAPHEWHVFEDYTIYFLEQIDGIARATDLIDRVDIPALILAEPNEKLGEITQHAILESLYQYGENDLAIIDWNSAVIVEPSGQRDLPDVLEFALTHLLEVRYYDDLLDNRLRMLYDSIERRRARMLRAGYSQLSHEASSRYIEFSELIERVDNSLKVVGDLYLATIFRAAARRFRLPDWQSSITRKMNLLAQVSELLQGEVNVRRSHWLELTIILLILFEIVSTLF